MTIFTYLFFSLLALISTILDISYFSFLPIGGSTILITFVIAIILASMDLRYYSIIFAAFSVLFYAGFSSVPMQYIMLLFIGIPLLVFYVQKRILFEQSYVSFLLTIVGAGIVFEIILVLFERNFTLASLLSAAMFVIMNSLVGIILFSFSKKITVRLKLKRD